VRSNGEAEGKRAESGSIRTFHSPAAQHSGSNHLRIEQPLTAHAPWLFPSSAPFASASTMPPASCTSSAVCHLVPRAYEQSLEQFGIQATALFPQPEWRVGRGPAIIKLAAPDFLRPPGLR